MKTIKLATLLFLPLIFSGCDIFDNIGDVTFSRTLNVSLNVNAGVSDQSIADVVLLNAQNDSEIQKYSSKIKSFTLNGITYGISNYDGPSPCNFTAGTMHFSQSQTSAGNIVASVSNLNLASAGTQQFDLDLSSTVSSQIENILKDDLMVYVHVAGNLSDAPVSFTLNLSFDLTVTANPL
ncbi:MAG TPA: hypothetical protein PKC24_03900 [Cyclobacteriaceae bacterium]|nr:hypothetical protein [Cyclobacteriaceae bacterium]